MDIIQEIIEAVDDYTRLHYEPPNKIYLARKTFFEVTTLSSLLHGSSLQDSSHCSI